MTKAGDAAARVKSDRRANLGFAAQFGRRFKKRSAPREMPVAVQQRLFALHDPRLRLGAQGRSSDTLKGGRAAAFRLISLVRLEDPARALPEHDAVMRIGTRFADNRHDLQSNSREREPSHMAIPTHFRSLDEEGGTPKD